MHRADLIIGYDETSEVASTLMAHAREMGEVCA